MAVPPITAKPGEVHCCPSLCTNTLYPYACQLANGQHCPGGAKAETASSVGPDPDLRPLSTATVQKKNRKMTSAKEHCFRCTLSSPQRRDRDTSECSYNMAALATDSAILTP